MTVLDETPARVETTTPPPAAGWWRHRPVPGWETWLALIPVAVLLVQGWQRRWVADDGLIHLRVVENVVHGHGFVFNAGERVEASTSVLWVALLAVLRLPRLVGVEMLAVVAGLVSTAAGLFLATRGAERLWRRSGVPSRLLPAGAIVLCVLPPMWDFATSGLETGFVFLWLGASFFLLAGLGTGPEGRSGRRFEIAAAVISAGPLIRPDLALFTGAFLLTELVLAWRTADVPKRRLAVLAALGVALPVAYQVFRMGYYGALVPTTAIAKEASRAWWGQGRRYLVDLLRTYWLGVPLALTAVLLAAGIWGWARARATDRLLVAAAPVVAGLADVLYVTRVGGDFMHGRLLLPGLFAVLMPVAVVEARSWWRTAAVALLVPWAVICAANLRLHYVVGPDGIADERSFYAISARHHNPVRAEDYAHMVLYHDGREAVRLQGEQERRLGWRIDHDRPVYTSMALRPDVPFHTAFVASNLGITGVIARPSVHIIDPSGLADPLASRVLLTGRGRPGHEKTLPLPWFVARFGDPAAPIPDGVSRPAVEAARRALGCGALRDLQTATTARLTPARFLRNVRLSIRLRDFRFQSDPAAAEIRFCGGP